MPPPPTLRAAPSIQNARRSRGSIPSVEVRSLRGTVALLTAGSRRTIPRRQAQLIAAHPGTVYLRRDTHGHNHARDVAVPEPLGIRDHELGTILPIVRRHAHQIARAFRRAR